MQVTRSNGPMVAPRAIAAIVALVLGLAVGYGIGLTVEGAGSATTSTSEDGAVSWLFVMKAGTGTFSDNGSGDLTLTFEDVKERVVTFSDRPVRVTGDMPLEAFATLWNEGGTFAEDPPNADLEFLTSAGRQQGRTLELTDVILNGGVTFSARALKGAGWVEEASATTSFSDAMLFIDGWGAIDHCYSRRDPDSCHAGYMAGYNAGFGGTQPDANEECQGLPTAEDCAYGYGLGYPAGEAAARRAPIPNT